MFQELNEGEWNLRVTKKGDSVTVILLPTGGMVQSPIRFTGSGAEMDSKFNELLSVVMTERKTLEEQAAQATEAAKAAAAAKAATAKPAAAKPAAKPAATANSQAGTVSPPAAAKSETVQQAAGFDIFAD